MSKGQKVLTTTLWGLVVLVMVGVVVGRLWMPEWPAEGASDAAIQVGGIQRPTDELPMLYNVPDFSLIDQRERPVSAEQLRGRPWVAAFVFTRCAGPCPMITQKMAKLQDRIDDPEVRLVSFSLDPEHDTPEVLREYAAAFEADESRWHFLTGEQSEILDTAAGMRLTAVPADGETEHQIIHSESLVLIDADGMIRGYYHGTDDEALARLAADVRRLSEATP